MINPQELQELGEQRRQALIQWREEQRLLAKLPRQETALETLSRQVIATIRKLESLGQARVGVEQPRADRVRRGA